jgi:hypothetical protein
MLLHDTTPMHRLTGQERAHFDFLFLDALRAGVCWFSQGKHPTSECPPGLEVRGHGTLGTMHRPTPMIDKHVRWSFCMGRFRQ